MLLNELFNSDFGEDSRKTANDNLAKKRIGDKRKPQITLQKLNSLRKLRELKKFEKLKQQSLVKIMYGGKAESAGF
jgi:hypothetical protein